MSQTNVEVPLSPLDLMPPKVYAQFLICLPLAQKATAKDVQESLQLSLATTFDQLPSFSGRLFPRPKGTEGWRPGHLHIVHSQPWDVECSRAEPRQLKTRDLSGTIDYGELKEFGFPLSMLSDQELLGAPFMPSLTEGPDVLMAQASFVKGGCLLAVAVHHSVADGVGVTNLMRIWAANFKNITTPPSKSVNGLIGKANTPAAGQASKIVIPPDVHDRELLQRVWEEDSAQRKGDQLCKEAWSLLGLDPEGSNTAFVARIILNTILSRLSFIALLVAEFVIDFIHRALVSVSAYMPENKPNVGKRLEVNGSATSPTAESLDTTPNTSMDREKQAAVSSFTKTLRVTVAQRTRGMKSSIFYISPQNLIKLKAAVSGSSKSSGEDKLSTISSNDALLAFFWRAMMQARVNAVHAVATSPDETALLQTTVDGRVDFSAKVPALYLGNVALINSIYMLLSEVTHPDTSLHEIAVKIRAATTKVNRETVHDAFALAADMPNYTNLTYAFTTLGGSAVLITSLLGLSLDSIEFGEMMFGTRAGRPDALRPLMGGFNSAFRVCMILPRTSSGGVQLLASLFDDEMEELLKNEEFGRFATFLCQ
jgi:Transferase family